MEKFKQGTLWIYENGEVTLAVNDTIGMLPRIIADAVEYATTKKVDFDLKIDGTGVTLPVTQYMTVEDAKEAFEFLQLAEKAVKKIKQRAYERSDDYKVQQEKITRKKEEKEAFIFHSVKEAFDAVKQVERIDFYNENLTQKEASDWGLKMMYIIAKCEELKFNEDEKKAFADELRKVGALDAIEAGTIESPFVIHRGIDESAKEPNNLAGPLLVLGQLLNLSTFGYGLNMACRGDLAKDWIKAQEEYNKTLNENNEIENQ